MAWMMAWMFFSSKSLPLVSCRPGVSVDECYSISCLSVFESVEVGACGFAFVVSSAIFGVESLELLDVADDIFRLLIVFTIDIHIVLQFAGNCEDSLVFIIFTGNHIRNHIDECGFACA